MTLPFQTTINNDLRNINSKFFLSLQQDLPADDADFKECIDDFLDVAKDSRGEKVNRKSSSQSKKATVTLCSFVNWVP